MALQHAQKLLSDPCKFNAQVSQSASGTHLIDLGVQAHGGLAAGKLLAEACLSGLGEVNFVPTQLAGVQTSVTVATDHPVQACMGSQYAGWQISIDKFFGMGSGPMRLLAKKEPLIKELQINDTSDVAVGILETAQIPCDKVCTQIAEQCGVSPEKLYLLVAKTSSLAGHIQIVARSVETAMHKLHELKFDINQVKSGFASAPLPPISADDVVGIGRTNDAILYGGQVTLWVDAEDQLIEEIGPQLPSSASAMYGKPFETILREAKFDFYKIDPLLFSPAKIQLASLRTGRSWTFGEVNEKILDASFQGNI
ncbi:MAG: methenyltetrahydromethanopterin cyclohydrolase [Blastopirellula sp.]|nr:MAG: methenyltetrahydromethanopterin cyclohydrolase [Blastopirellula sp.]